MNDAFLPGNGFDTYEEQDRVLMGLSGSVRSGVAVRILQQQGFAVADRKSTRLNSSHNLPSRMPSSA